jgi:hypothetical protein
LPWLSNLQTNGSPSLAIWTRSKSACLASDKASDKLRIPNCSPDSLMSLTLSALISLLMGKRFSGFLKDFL